MSDTHMNITIPPRNWISLDSHKLIQNYTHLKNCTKHSSIIACCVKSNAYGFGIQEVATILSQHDPECWFCVQDTAEAITLRNAGITQRILLVSALFTPEFEIITSYNITPLIGDYQIAHAFIDYLVSKQLYTFPFHVQYDSGMGWLGLYDAEVLTLCSKAKESGVYIEGIATHFATSDEARSELYTLQKQRFSDLQQKVQNTYHITYWHCANTGAVINDAHLTQRDIIQPGIGLYGILPSEYTYTQAHDSHGMSFELIGSLHTTIAHIKTIPAGAGVGYCWSHQCQQDTTIAVLPIGYYNGIQRQLSNSYTVYVDSIPCPQIGTIGMNSMMIDITHIKDIVTYTSDVVLFAHADDIEHMASTCHTIPYEIMARLHDIPIMVHAAS